MYRYVWNSPLVFSDPLGYDGWIKGTLKAIGSGLKWVVKQVLGTKFPTNILDPTPIGLDRHEEIRDSLSNRADSLDQLANDQRPLLA